MKITQLHEILDPVTKEVLGETAVVNEDLSNVVDIGKELTDANNVDNFMKKLANRIGKTIFVDRPYAGRAPSVLMDGWTYGSILQKIESEIPPTQENPTWDLKDGTDYPVTKFIGSTVSQKFFNQKDTYEIQKSFARRQVEQSFINAQGVNGLFSLLQNWVERGKTINSDNLIMRTINTFIGATLYSEYGDDAKYGDASHVKAINLLKEYNDTIATTALTADKCMTNLAFLKYAAYRITMVLSRMRVASKLFNIGKTTKFTSDNDMHLVMLADLAKAAEYYLQSDTFHDTLVKMPKAETVPYWQGSGQDYAFKSVSGIDVIIQKPDTPSETVTVKADGILAVAFDRNALGVCNVRDYVTSFYNPHGEFENMWYKVEAQYFNDYNENGVVFFVADPSPVI